MHANVDDPSPRLLSFQESLGRFLVVSPKGQLFALDDVRIAEDYSKVVPGICPADFHVATTVGLKLDESNLTLVLQPRDQASAYFLTRLPGGASNKPIKVFQEAEEIVRTAVDNGRFPVIVLADLHRMLTQARARMTAKHLPAPPIPLPVRYLVLRPTAPTDWVDSISKLFLLAAEGDPDKAEVLNDRLDELNTRIKRSMVRQYLLDCLWTDPGRKRIGRMSCSEDGASLRNFVSGAPELLEFTDALAVSDDGRYDSVDEVANVIPRMVAKMPWTAPTIHIYDDAVRRRYKLQEFYSLYSGLRELSAVGAPVLVNQPGVLDSVIPVSLIKTMTMSEGMQPGKARVYPIRKVVWNA